MPKRSRIVLQVFLTALFLFFGVQAVRAQSFQRSVLSADQLDVFSTAVGDVDGDGDKDVMMSGFTGYLGWLETRTDRSHAYHPLELTTGYLRNIVPADFNHDRFTDFVLAAYSEGRVYIITPHLEQNQLAFDTVSLGAFAGPFDVRVADLNQDGSQEIIATDYTGNTLRMFQLTNGVWTEFVGFSRIFHPWSIRVVDFDGDNDLDVVCACDAYGGQNYGLLWFEQVAFATWTPHTLRGPGESYFVSAADLDGDNDLDLVVSDTRDGRIDWLRRDGANFSTVALSTNFSHVRTTEIADFNDDDLLDIAAIGADGQVAWWQQTSSHTFTFNNLPANFQCLGLTVDDVDQDGDPDLLVAETQQDQLVQYSNLMGIPSLLYGDISAAQSGAPVVNALVRLQQTGVSTYTDNSGRFRLVTTPGIFTVEVRHVCYDSAIVENVECAQDDSVLFVRNLTRPVIHLGLSSLNLIVPNRLETTHEVSVENGGDGNLRVSAAVQGNYPEQVWLRVSPAELIVLPDSSAIFTVIILPDTSDQQNWDYQGLVTLRTNSCPDTLIRIPVNAYVLDAPDASVPSPAKFAIERVYPNPFNNSTRITFTLPHSQEVLLALYDLQGRESRRLMSGLQTAGEHEINFSGDGLAAGIYFLTLTGREQHSTAKIVLLK